MADRLLGEFRFKVGGNDEYTAPEMIWQSIQENIGTGEATVIRLHFKSRLFPLLTTIPLLPNLKLLAIWNRSTTQSVLVHFEFPAHNAFDVLLAPNSLPLVIPANPEIGSHVLTEVVLTHIAGASADVDALVVNIP